MSEKLMSELTKLLKQEEKTVGKGWTKELAKHNEGVVGGIDKGFEDFWQRRIVDKGGLVEAFRQGEGIVLTLKKIMPEGVRILEEGFGENWWEHLNDKDVTETHGVREQAIKDLAAASFKRLELGDMIVDGLSSGENGKLELPSDKKKRLTLLNKALSYADARADLVFSLAALQGEVAEVNPAAKFSSQSGGHMEERYQLEEHFATPDYIGRTMSDPMTDENREDRVYDAEYMTKRVEARLNMVMPQILASADMLSVESEQKLLARLGVTRVGDGNEFSLMSSDWQSNEDQRAMYMVLNQNLRHSVINRQISIFNPDMDEDGTSRESIVNGGVDLLLLHLYQREAVQDCGRYFQEQVRKTVIRERIGEILLWEAQRTEATRSGESILRSNIRAAVDAIFVAEDMFGIINKGVNSVLSRIEPGSFMDKVVGGIASGVRGVKELFGGVADRVPSEFPMRATSRRKGGFFKMPDFFS